MYDIAILGAGHAGAEAAYTAQRLGLKTVLVSFSINDIAHLPCNVSIGGSAKGIVVKELAVFGALMPMVSDKTQLQTKILNQSKGAAVRSMRAQVDKLEYPKVAGKILLASGIDFKEGKVVSLILKNGFAKGIVLDNGEEILSKRVLITAGTFLKSVTMKGKELIKEGPDGKLTVDTISTQLANNNVKLIRLKTGTPPRVFTSSIDFSKLQVEGGSEKPIYFTNEQIAEKKYENIPAWLTYTTPQTHKIIEEHIKESYLFNNAISGSGPRYCPSIEDKVKRFPDKERHQIFLEIESKNLDTTYLAGLSSSMPTYVQDKFVKTLIGLENAKIKKYAYAIEYDSLDPTQLFQTLEMKEIGNLFFAGQVNGTSGYEEAAAQGLVAAINIWSSINKKKPFILARSDAYIGVMIDDITTKGVQDPYRLLTSRAEYRLLLRDDNAEKRLFEIANEYGLMSKERYLNIQNKFKKHEEVVSILHMFKISQSESEDFFKKHNLKITDNGYNLLKRPGINLKEIVSLKPTLFPTLTEDDVRSIEIEIKFSGYIEKQKREVKKYLKNQKLILRKDFDFSKVPNLAIEAREKLIKFKPSSIHQASNISGVNPADIMVLMNYINRKRNES